MCAVSVVKALMKSRSIIMSIQMYVVLCLFVVDSWLHLLLIIVFARFSGDGSPKMSDAGGMAKIIS